MGTKHDQTTLLPLARYWFDFRSVQDSADLSKQRLARVGLFKELTPPLLSTIQARTLIVQGDRDPLYPVELSVEMARAIPHSRLWIIPNAGHGPVIGERWGEFLKTASAFLLE